MRIGVVSDTHIPRRARCIPRQVFDGLMGVDLIIHAGDIVCMQVLSELSTIAPVQAVCGNMDPTEVRRQVPRTRIVEADGWRIGVVHGDGASGSTKLRALRTFSDVHCVVFGHSHRACCERHGSVLLFNPGSPTDRRANPEFSYGLLSVSSGGVRGEIRFFAP